MLSVRPKINELTFRVYSRSLHPELLETHASRTIERDNYRLKMGITTAGHFLHFKTPKNEIFEVATSSHHDLPASALISRTIKNNFSEKIHLFGEPGVSNPQNVEYESSIRLERVGATQLFSFNQVMNQCDPSNALTHRFEPNGRINMGAMSYLNIESRIQSVRIQAVHTFPDTSTFMTTESVFRLNGSTPG